MKQVANKFLLAGLFMAALAVLAGKAWAQSSNLDWLSGNWCLTADNQTVEESWSSAVGGQLLGMSRTIVGGTVVAFEFLRIETTDGTTQYIAQPGGGAGTVFTASRVSENQLIVENPAHDFPQKITYQRDGDVLTAMISGAGDGGHERSVQFAYQPCNG